MSQPLLYFQALSILQGLLPGPGEEAFSGKHVERLFIFSLMWSFGALLELDDRAKMEEFLATETELELPEIMPGSGDTIFEYKVDSTGKKRTKIISECLRVEKKGKKKKNAYGSLDDDMPEQL